ncbi:FG-GAP-like repeat-containing protein [Arthrobacter sp. PsM3]|uniref:FG-GAP-like repeat-containing protein n=1 Tax=Arthrobacter sp. PsM3 TaxID=3030531 RepID=UPI00263AF5B8|nr:FG-GAP-like repeat-containing protein [Arthrobacter sp. PsM3]MDN4646515.1 FG-GAP-like repeat-containing protein [Arthrobacter sp. PsM3]
MSGFTHVRRRALRAFTSRGIALALAAAILASAGGASTALISAAPAEAASTQTQVDAAVAQILSGTNAERVKADLQPLRVAPSMNSVSQNWTQAMAAQSLMTHNPYFSTQLPQPWMGVAENVAMGFTAGTVVAGWMNSPGHRANILGDYTHIGIGYWVDGTGRAWFTQNFGKYDVVSQPSMVGEPAIVVDKSGFTSSWVPTPNETVTRYDVQLYAAGGTTLLDSKTTTSPTVTFTGLTASTGYVVKVAAVAVDVPGLAYSSPVKTFTVTTSAPAPTVPGAPKRLNDFTGDGKTDVIARDASGELWLYPGTGTGDWSKRIDLGGGWNVMSTIVSAGDFNGDGKADVIARDTSGELWFYPGTGTGDWSKRQDLGAGWNVMTSIVAPGDFNADGKPDLIARDSSGELWLYPNNGAGDWLKRVDLGAGWNIMNSIVAPGDFNADGKVDLVARDTSGQLWLYPGNGQNEWFKRVDLGAGWNTMNAITAPGDMDSDGRPDVIARDTTGELWLYPNNGAGDWFKRIDLGPGWNPMTAIL